MLRAGMVALAIAGGLVGVTAPAHAAPGDPTIMITGLDNGNLQPGGQATLTFTVTAGRDGPINIAIASSLAPDVTLRHNGNNCGPACNYTFALMAGQSKDDSVTLIAAQNPTTVQ